MAACTFFGHREGVGIQTEVLRAAIEDLIGRGVDTFFVGNHGDFDWAVFCCLKELQKTYPRIRYAVVFAYLPGRRQEYDPYEGCHIYPEGLELALPKFAIEARNKWMIDQSDYCLCYVSHTWGNAWKFAGRAKRQGLTVINLGNSPL